MNKSDSFFRRTILQKLEINCIINIFKYFKLILKISQFRKMMIREIYIILNHQEMKMI